MVYHHFPYLTTISAIPPMLGLTQIIFLITYSMVFQYISFIFHKILCGFIPTFFFMFNPDDLRPTFVQPRRKSQTMLAMVHGVHGSEREHHFGQFEARTGARFGSTVGKTMP